jgi:hypothetical protein
MLPEKPPFILNCRKSDNEKKKDWGPASATAAGYLPAELPEPPEECDLRRPWWEIRDQGETHACVGFAVADSVLRWHFVKSENKNHIREADLLSVRYLWMAAKETDEFIDRPTTFIDRVGTDIKTALRVAQKYGVVLEKELRLNSGRLSSKEEGEFYAIAAKRRINSYFNLREDIKGIDDLKLWKRWIRYHGPIAVRLDVDNEWNSLWNLEANSKKKNLDNYDKNTAGGGHACALVGYTKDRFIVRNSWGEIWGDGGFAFATNDYVFDAFTEAYGVAIDDDVLET